MSRSTPRASASDGRRGWCRRDLVALVRHNHGERPNGPRAARACRCDAGAAVRSAGLGRASFKGRSTDSRYRPKSSESSDSVAQHPPGDLVVASAHHVVADLLAQRPQAARSRRNEPGAKIPGNLYSQTSQKIACSNPNPNTGLRAEKLARGAHAFVGAPAATSY